MEKPIYVRLAFQQSEGDLYDFLSSYDTWIKGVTFCLTYRYFCEKNGIILEAKRKECEKPLRFSPRIEHALETGSDTFVRNLIFKPGDGVLHEWLVEKKKTQKISKFVKESVRLYLDGQVVHRNKEDTALEKAQEEKKKNGFSFAGFGSEALL